MAYLGRNQDNDLIFQQGPVSLKIGTPESGVFDSLEALSRFEIPAFDNLFVNPSGTSVLGTVSGSSTWEGQVIGTEYGGTGRETYNEGDLLVGNSASGLDILPSGAETQIIQISGGALAWVPKPDIRDNYPVVDTTGDYVVQNDDLMVALSGATPIVVSLPSSPDIGQRHIIKDAGGLAATNNITVSGIAGPIDGNASALLNVDYQSLTVVWIGTVWSII